MALSACNTETDSAGRELTVHGTAAFPIACYLRRSGSCPCTLALA